MRISTVLASSVLLLTNFNVPDLAHAENTVGRYQMATLPTKPGSFDSRVMILDTTNGDLWQWWEAPAVGSSVPSSGITYLGKVMPSNTVGETTPTRRSNPVEPLVPRH